MPPARDDELRRERPTGGEVWRLVPGNGHAHVAQHVSSWLAEHDDPVGAEATAVWAYTLETELFPEPADRAVADFNLACFYARNRACGGGVAAARQCAPKSAGPT